jgi:hypothetical protein
VEVTYEALGDPQYLLSLSVVEKVISGFYRLISLKIFSESVNKGHYSDSVDERGKHFDLGSYWNNIPVFVKPWNDQLLSFRLLFGRIRIPLKDFIVVLPKDLRHDGLHVLPQDLCPTIAEVLFGKVVGVDDCSDLVLVSRNGHVGCSGTELVFGVEVVGFVVIF